MPKPNVRTRGTRSSASKRDGDPLSAWYAGPNGTLTELASVASGWDSGEKWRLLFGGYDVEQGAEVGSSRLRYASAGPFVHTVDGNSAFTAFRCGIAAYYAFEGDDFGCGSTQASVARSALVSATTQTRDQGAFPDTDVWKNLGKADKGHFELVDELSPDQSGSYFETFPKVAEGRAWAMEGMYSPF
jgi:hypothetical protein